MKQTTYQQETDEAIKKLLEKCNVIDESELPSIKMPWSLWRKLFNKIPQGKAWVLEGKEGNSAYLAMRKFKSRTDEFKEFEGMKRGDKYYFVHWSKDKLLALKNGKPIGGKE